MHTGFNIAKPQKLKLTEPPETTKEQGSTTGPSTTDQQLSSLVTSPRGGDHRRPKLPSEKSPGVSTDPVRKSKFQRAKVDSLKNKPTSPRGTRIHTTTHRASILPNSAEAASLQATLDNPESTATEVGEPLVSHVEEKRTVLADELFFGAVLENETFVRPLPPLPRPPQGVLQEEAIQEWKANDETPGEPTSFTTAPLPTREEESTINEPSDQLTFPTTAPRPSEKELTDRSTDESSSDDDPQHKLYFTIERIKLETLLEIDLDIPRPPPSGTKPRNTMMERQNARSKLPSRRPGDPGLIKKMPNLQEHQKSSTSGDFYELDGPPKIPANPTITNANEEEIFNFDAINKLLDESTSDAEILKILSQRRQEPAEIASQEMELDRESEKVDLDELVTQLGVLNRFAKSELGEVTKKPIAHATPSNLMYQVLAPATSPKMAETVKSLIETHKGERSEQIRALNILLCAAGGEAVFCVPLSYPETDACATALSALPIGNREEYLAALYNALKEYLSSDQQRVIFDHIEKIQRDLGGSNRRNLLMNLRSDLRAEIRI